jgi:hypothetical protein
MPVILATQEVEIRRVTVGYQPKQTEIPCLDNTQHNKMLAEWLVSNPSTIKKKSSKQKNKIK